MPWVTAPDGRRHRSHRFPGSGDRALLSRAVRVEGVAQVTARGTTVRVTVSPDRIGHAFPTGDLFRRAELTVWLDDDAAHAQTVTMARAFGPSLERDPHGRPVFVRRQSADTRVQPPGVGVVVPRELRFARTGAVVRWRLDHLRMPSPMAAAQGFGEPRVRTLVAEGRFDVTPQEEHP